MSELDRLIAEAVDLMSSQQAMPDDKSLERLAAIVRGAHQLGTPRTEFRLVRVQGDSELLYARGSRDYTEYMFQFHGAHTMPKSLAARFGKEPVTWEVREVEVTERVLSTTVKTPEEVEAARRAAAENIPPEMRTYEDREKLQ